MPNHSLLRRSILAPLAAVLVVTLSAAAPAAPAEDSTSTKVNPAQAATTASRVLVHDDVEGTGPALENGRSAVVHYVATLADGTVFDASREKLLPSPLRFKMGSGQMIPGFEEGITGMKAGGTRTITIPPEKAYGAKGRAPMVPPNATLKFRIDLLRVE